MCAVSFGYSPADAAQPPVLADPRCHCAGPQSLHVLGGNVMRCRPCSQLQRDAATATVLAVAAPPPVLALLVYSVPFPFVGSFLHSQKRPRDARVAYADVISRANTAESGQREIGREISKVKRGPHTPSHTLFTVERGASS